VHLGLARSGVVQHQGRVDLRPAARLAGPLDGESVSEIELDAGVVRDRGQRRPAVTPEQRFRRELGDPLRDERLRRGHEHQRLLEQPSAAHEQVLLAGALRVVAGIRLVDREPEQLDGRHRQIDVDGDPAAQVAEVVAGRQPGLVAHDLQHDAFAGRQLDQAARPRARLLDGRRHRALDLLGGHEDRVLPALVPLRQRPVAGEQLLEPLVRGCEEGFLGVGRPHAVASLHLVGVRGGLARQHAGVGAQPDHLVVQPAVLELVEQGFCRGDQRSRLDGRRRLDGCRRLRRSEVGIDDPFDVAAELQAQPEIALRDGLGHAVSLRRCGCRAAERPRTSLDVSGDDVRYDRGACGPRA